MEFITSEYEATTKSEILLSAADEHAAEKMEENIREVDTGFTFTPFIESVFHHDDVPMWQHICIIWTLFVLGSILNGFVIKVYWRIKSTCRVYVLAMAVIDLVCLNFVLLPRFVLLFLGEGLLREVVELIRHEIAILIFSVHTTIPFLLALDRLVAVLFPHKLHIMLKRVRPLKVVALSLDVLWVLLKSLDEQNIGGIWVVIFGNVIAAIAPVKTLSFLIMYVIIAVKVRSAAKGMASHIYMYMYRLAGSGKNRQVKVYMYTLTVLCYG